MSVEIVHPVPDAEFAGWVETMQTTFLARPERQRRAVELWGRRLPSERRWGAREDGRWVATLGADVRTLTVPGGELVADAITGVSVAATHSRRGLLRAMIDDSARSARERGHAVSVLIPSEWPIYGRYGYGPAAGYADYEFLLRARGAEVAGDPGAVRLAGREELAAVGPQLFDRARRLRAGQVDRPPSWWARLIDEDPLDGPFRALLHEDGLLVWRPSGDFGFDGSMATVHVSDLVAATPTAYRDLWAYLSRLDVVERVLLPMRPVDEPARWLLGNGRALRQTYAGDLLWLRFLDARAALAARAYAVPGRLVLDLLEDGLVELDGGPDGATCTSTTRSPDVRLSARVLASAYLGGYRLSAVPDAAEELTPGALARLDAMFATLLAPWCQTGF